MKPRAALLVAMTGCLLALPAAAGAETPTDSQLRTAMISQGWADSGLALGAGRAYWWDEGSRNVGLFQSSAVPGSRRTVFKVRRGAYSAVYASGEFVAFALSNVTRMPKVNGRHGLLLNQIWTMNADDAAPTLLASDQQRLIVKRTVKHHKGRKITVTSFDLCGNSLELVAVSAQRRVVYDHLKAPCGGGRGSEEGVVQDAVTGFKISTRTYQTSMNVKLSGDQLLRTPNERVELVNLATGGVAKYRGNDDVDQIALAPNGEVATVTDADVGREIASRVKFFPAGSTNPTAHYTVGWFDLVSITPCNNGSFVDIREDSRKMKITLRALNGSVIKRIYGPRSGLDYETECNGARLTLAAQKGFAAPQFFSYDF